MPDLFRRALLALAAAALLAGLNAGPGRAEGAPVFAPGGVAINGYDPVAYFTEGRPVEGLKGHQVKWHGAIWRFASTANMEAFEMNPKAYAPQYGGYCAYAVAHGYTAKTEPEAWSIHDGRLYLNYDIAIRATWETDKPGYIARADANWPDLAGK